MDRYESLVDRQIRAAQERGEFDDLPGAGRPIPGAGEPYDENWWVKSLLKRENVSVPLPTMLALRKEIAELPRTLATETKESSVREILADLNARIRTARRAPSDGPAFVLSDVDVAAVVAAWRSRR